ncbi:MULTISPECIES: hypothetical protein [Actinokineospora]|uniref:Uncharacterized protein n=1 Tax=Actinokineospora fastidiosa TaxID=1816 RepID=A0A918LCW0_9PSEU|nr:MULTISPECIES: hypothetical protein [Actinokineospora]UVS79825.1 hypothetical protein Actkin_03575 [Actinokineospora sp. UTMC 2448]GGS31083.1 hypothetical protein GCM10010171_26160 [Actinokineospora fastidiosa]
MDADRSRREAVRRHVDRAIILRCRVYLAIFLVASAVAVVEAVLAGGWTLVFAAAGLLAGIAVGHVVSRMFRLEWHEFERKAVGKIDVVGAVILVAYLLVAVNRARLVDLWVPAASAGATSMAVLAGIMLGQVLGIRRGLIALYRRTVAAG